jgi:hypothetical protein
LGSLFASLVLVSSVDQKLIRVAEYLTLRRVHAFENKELVKIIHAYSILSS